MKVVILAGGFGTRFSEDTDRVPKPMIEIGGKPILWHIINIYASYGFNEFVLALGYKSEVIKSYFLHFFSLNNDFSIDLESGKSNIHQTRQLNWKIDLVDTGVHSQTGGRLKLLQPWIGDETFMMTYGDGLADINIHRLVQFHKQHGKLATVTAVHPPARFGSLKIQGTQVVEFAEKKPANDGWINGGFFVLEPEVFNYIDGTQTSLENEPLEQLTREGQLMAFFHNGFWKPMDTLREQRQLERLWNTGAPPWKALDEQKNDMEEKEGASNRSYRSSGIMANSTTN